MFRFEKRAQKTRGASQMRLSSCGGHDAAKQSRRPVRGRRNQFPPPKAAPDYMTRKLPALPPKPSSTSPLLCISEEASFRTTHSGSYRERESPETHHTPGRSSSAIVELEYTIKEYGTVMARSQKISILTDFEQANRSFGSAQREAIHSPQPKYPIHQILKGMDIHDGSQVSPAMSAPALTLSSHSLEVSPLTPKDTLSCGFGRAVSEPDHDAQYWANCMEKVSIQDLHEEDMPPVAPHSSSPGFLLVPVRKARKKSAPRTPPLQFRHSEPCSPVETCSGSPREFRLTASKPQLSLVIGSNISSRPRSENSKAIRGQPTSDMSEYIITGHHSPWRREYGQKRFSPESSSSSGISFAVREIPSFSTRPKANRKPKPKPLKFHDCKRADEHVKTPYPWDDKKLEMNQPSGSSWDSTDITASGKTEASEGKSRRVSRLVSRVKHAGGVVISRLSFTSEETRRARRAEELRRKIQHLGAQSTQKNMF